MGAVVARGEAEIGFQQISELISIPGIDYVGPLPSEVQHATLLCASSTTASRTQDAAQVFIKFLASPEVAHDLTKAGLEPTHLARSER